MRRSFALILILCLCSVLLLCSCADSSEETRVDGKKYPVYTDDGSIKGYEREYHNSDGFISRLDVFDENDTYDHYVTYEYDEEGRLIQETTYRADGIGDYYYSYEYDADGNLAEKGYFSSTERSYIIKYDSSGEETEKYYYDTDGELESYEVLENGEWVSHDASDYVQK